MKNLVIGYGNTLRGDDGVGYRIAEAIADWNFPEIKVIASHQLTPELALEIANCDRVIFVDAALPGNQKTVDLQVLRMPQFISLQTHCSDPKELLGLAFQLYGSCPMAYQVLVPTQTMSFTEELSKTAQLGFETALQKIQSLCDVPQTSQY